MKRIILTASLLTAIFFASNAQIKNFIDQPYIEVNGTADTLITPNQIFIKIIISEKDNKNKEPLENLESKMVAALQSIGIKTETYLTTSDMLSTYKFYFLKQKDILKSKEYILEVPDAATAGKVFTQLENIGISNTSIDRVDHTELESIKNICRTRAIINAKQKGEALVKPLSQTIGNAIQITDNEIVFNNQLQGRVAGVVVTGYGTLDKAKQEAPQIEFEKIRVETSVGVKFILK